MLASLRALQQRTLMSKRVIEFLRLTIPHRNLYDFLNDEKYSEADIYTVFKRIMELDQKQMFAVSQPSKVAFSLLSYYTNIYIEEEEADI